MLLSYATVNFYLFYDGAADLLYEPKVMTRSLCRVSDTQMTVKVLGPLVYSQKLFHSVIILNNKEQDVFVKHKCR